MAYNPSLYNPYGSSQFQPAISYPQANYQPIIQQPVQQPVDGVIWIDGIEGALMYPLPANSVSPPLMLKNEAAFIIKTTDGGGAATYQKGSFKLENLQINQPTDTITRADFEDFKREMMEVINGKPAVQTEPTEE